MLKELLCIDINNMKTVSNQAYLWRYIVNKKQYSKFTPIKIVDLTSRKVTDRHLAVYKDKKTVLVSKNELECVIRSGHAFIWSYVDWSDDAIISIFENELTKYYDEKIAEENNKIQALKNKKYDIIESLKSIEKNLKATQEMFE